MHCRHVEQNVSNGLSYTVLSRSSSSCKVMTGFRNVGRSINKLEAHGGEVVKAPASGSRFAGSNPISPKEYAMADCAKSIRDECHPLVWCNTTHSDTAIPTGLNA
ncbi:hypothetical protein AVEN_200995-1 [Araneus ventricosus]|uniref:Uncharacterized protein n=1 Tax=Araneus ventricosus TaxID=182803 RepID=A0A4Y2QPM3_ARAVE|nr:hypothetical protein AVEN_200995-1 [Araneus ventricosus]